MRHLWIDASAGVAGDMLLGALIDAGADLDVVRAAVEAVIPASVRLTVQPVTRAGMRAAKLDVQPLVTDPPARSWRTIRDRLAAASLAEPVRNRAVATFARLAAAEGRVHGIDAGEVHFHEVGALDSIADVVGVAAAWADLGVESATVSEVALGSGLMRAAHGELPIPGPAVAELARGWAVRAGGAGELTTPTGMALVATLAAHTEDLPGLIMETVGVGAGTRDRPGRANVTRVILGEQAAAPTAPGGDEGQPAVLLAANVDDLDPRLWPGVLARLLIAGAADAWLTPIVMKKGRPAHTLQVLAAPDQVATIRELMITTTSTFGVRQHPVIKHALPRSWLPVAVGGQTVQVKIAHRDGVIAQVTPEFADVAAAAERLGRSEHSVLTEAHAAAAALGLHPGAAAPAAGVAPEPPLRSRP